MYRECRTCKVKLDDFNKIICSKQCYDKSKFKTFIDKCHKIFEFIENKIGWSNFIKLSEANNYPPAVLRDILIRDYNFDENINLDLFRRCLYHKMKFNFNAYNKLPQIEKIKFKYSKKYTEQQILDDINYKCKQGQKNTIQIRKIKGNLGNPKFKRKDSPLCLEYYESRGFSENYANEHIQKICLAGALATLKVSKYQTEETVKSILQEKNIEYKKQFELKLLDEEKKYNKKSYVYDFYVPNFNLIIECNGLYWHASPKIYNSGDLIKIPRFGEVKVDYIWELDSFKKSVAEKRGYKYIVLWENEEQNLHRILEEF